MVDWSNNDISGTFHSSPALQDYDIRFDPLDADQGSALNIVLDNNFISGSLPARLLQHAEVSPKLSRACAYGVTVVSALTPCRTSWCMNFTGSERRQ